MTQAEWKNIFADNLSSILKEKKMSQAQLSKHSGVSTAMISDYVNKRAIPGLVAAINMAHVLDVDLTDFAYFDDSIE